MPPNLSREVIYRILWVDGKPLWIALAIGLPLKFVYLPLQDYFEEHEFFSDQLLHAWFWKNLWAVLN